MSNSTPHQASGTLRSPIIPIPDGKKATKLKKWSNLSPDELERIMANHRGNRGQRLDGLASLDPDSQAAVQLCEQWDREGKLPETWTYKTARGIIRRMYKRPASLTGPLTIKEISFQLRTGPGLYDVIPPSRVTDPEKGIDGVYEWLPGLDPESIPLADLPQEILEYFKTHAQAPPVEPGQRNGAPVMGDEIPFRERNNTLTSLAGSMRRRGMSQEEIEAALLVANKNRCKPSLSEAEVLAIARSVSRYATGGNDGVARGVSPPQEDGPQKTAWALAAQLFPRIPFPWEALPSDIAESLQQLGRACATSSTALPGAAFCMVASIMGRTQGVSPKKSWIEPLTIWHMDIRDSGDGKTPAVRLMAAPLHEAQREEEKRYEEEKEAYDRLSQNDQKKQPPPAPPRGYFVTDLTLEGLREDLVHSPHGGIVVIQDEISAFLSAQNQYKPTGGNDRESWLALHDGQPARVKRVGRCYYITGARVSIFGGVQPKVFRAFFAGADGLYLDDGTLFRFLATCEPSTYHELTEEAWEDSHQGNWETLLHRALDWVEGEIYAREGKIEKPVRMILTSEAQRRFLEWRNQITAFKSQLPAQMRGFIPKAVGYALRLSGVIHCIQQFSIGKTPQSILTVDDLERGIKAVSFYLGQIQDALRLIENEDHVPVEVSERSRLLARTLERLRPNLDNGRLAVGYIQVEYNKIGPKTQHIGSPRAMGALIRAVGLTIAPDKHDANGKRAVCCLDWDQQTEKFIKQNLQTPDWVEDIGNPAQTLQTLEKQCLHQETCASSDPTDIADIADVGASTFSQFSPSANWQEVPEGVAIPPGAEVRMNMATGKNYARWPDGADNVASGIAETEQEVLAGEDPGESIMEVEI